MECQRRASSYPGAGTSSQEDTGVVAQGWQWSRGSAPPRVQTAGRDTHCQGRLSTEYEPVDTATALALARHLGIAGRCHTAAGMADPDTARVSGTAIAVGTSRSRTENEPRIPAEPVASRAMHAGHGCRLILGTHTMCCSVPAWSVSEAGPADDDEDEDVVAAAEGIVAVARAASEAHVSQEGDHRRLPDSPRDS